jgi:cytochrome b561
MSEVATIWPLSIRLMHWLNAALVVGAFGCRAIMVLFVHHAATRFDLTQTHKGIGVSALRLCLHFLMRAPKPETHLRAVAHFAKPAHTNLCVLLLLPFSGWLMLTCNPVRVPTVIFRTVELPYHTGHRAIPFGTHIGMAVVLATLIVLCEAVKGAANVGPSRRA